MRENDERFGSLFFFLLLIFFIKHFPLDCGEKIKKKLRAKDRKESTGVTTHHIKHEKKTAAAVAPPLDENPNTKAI